MSRSSGPSLTARGACLLGAAALLAGCAATEVTASDDVVVGDVVGDGVGGDDTPTLPLLPTTVQVTRDGREVVATCGARVCRWPVDGGAARAAGVGGEALLADAGVALRTSGTQVLVVDVATGEVTATFDEHVATRELRSPIGWVALSPDGALAVSTGVTGRQWSWRTADGSVVRRIATPSADSAGRPVFDTDGTLLSVGWSEGVREDAVGMERVIDLTARTGNGVLAAPRGLARAEAFSPDGRWLVGMTDEAEIGVWGTDEWTLDATSASRGVGPVAVSTDSATVAFVDAADDTAVRLWTPATGEVRSVTTDHADPITGLALSPDGTRLASASAPPYGDGLPPEDDTDEVQVRRIDGPPAGPGDVVRLVPPGT